MKNDQTVYLSNLNQLLQKNLQIPFYQRPYRWKAKVHAKQLLEDIISEYEKKSSDFRIGTIILHQEKNSYNVDIVDGQQRLVTLSLILYFLSEVEEKADLTELQLLNNEFDHEDSKNNLKFNFDFFRDYLGQESTEYKAKLKDFLLNHCRVLIIQLSELSEAFQLFDSQNARGKSLNPADLLKAYHLREMEDIFENEKYRMVNRWEDSIDKKELNDVIANYLFRLRSWSEQDLSYFFTKNNLSKFKGVSPEKLKREGKTYPYLQKLLVQSSSNLFYYNQEIINGKWFFEYVSHYTDLVNNIEKLSFSNKIKLDYDGHHRIGDQRLIKLFKKIILVYVDKFGRDRCFKEFSELLFRWVFITRLEKKQIRYEAILKRIENKNNPIIWIQNWQEPELIDMKQKVPSVKNIEIDERRREFKKGGIFEILRNLEN